MENRRHLEKHRLPDSIMHKARRNLPLAEVKTNRN